MTPLQILEVASGLLDIFKKLKDLQHADAAPVPPETEAQVTAVCKALAPAAWGETPTPPPST